MQSNVEKIAKSIHYITLSESTRREYQRVAKRSVNLSIEELATLKRATRRVAVAALKRNFAMSVLRGDPLERVDAEKKLLLLCDAFPDLETTVKARDNRSLEQMFAAQVAAEEPRVIERVTSKKQMLSSLPKDWRERVLNESMRTRSKYRGAICALFLTGARPEEIRRGIRFSMSEDGAIEAHINCAKSRSTEQFRTLKIGADSSQAAKVIEGVLKQQGSLTIRYENKSALTNAVRRAGRKLFKTVRQDLTPYCFRHQFSADQKRAGIGSVLVAAALGHSSDKMQSKYGSALQSAGGAQVLSVECTREPKAERAKQLEKLKSKSLTRQRSR